MRAREKKMMYATIAVLAIWAVYSMGGSSDDESTGEGLFGASSSDVELARQEYDVAVQSVADAPRIVEEFAELAGADSISLVPDKGKAGASQERPDLEFQKDVADWCREVGFSSPDVTKKIEDIHDKDNKLVREYQLVVVTVNIRDGDLARVSQLLKIFEQRGLIIQEVSLQGSQDSNRLSANIVIARLVNQFFLTREHRMARGK